MTIEDAEKRIMKIQEASGDPEKAHILEDQLYASFIMELKENRVKSEDIQKIASIILKTEEIRFPRWFA